MSGVAAKDDGNSSSLIQGLSKRNTATATLRSAISHSSRPEIGSLDGDRKASNQPRNLFQLAGIVMLDDLRQPGQAFVVAHRRHFLRKDRWHKLLKISQDILHYTTP